MSAVTESRAADRGAWWRNEFIRGIVLQLVVAFAIIAIAAFFIHNTVVNLEKRGIASGFGFLRNTAGFDISIALIPYSISESTYARAFLVSLINTLMVSGIGIVLATILGFVIGVARLSKNFLIRTLAAVYVDVIRNIPLLVQIIFWYFGVLTTLPGVKQSLKLFDVFFLNGRGLYMPAPILQPGFWILPAVAIVGIVAAAAVTAWARRRQVLTGQQFHSFWVGLALIAG